MYSVLLKGVCIYDNMRLLLVKKVILCLISTLDVCTLEFLTVQACSVNNENLGTCVCMRFITALVHCCGCYKYCDG